MLAKRNGSADASETAGFSLDRIAPGTVECPCCKSGSMVQGLYLFPIVLDDLDRAVRIRKSSAVGNTSAADILNDNGKRDSSDLADFLDIQAEASYLLLSHSNLSSSSSINLGGCGDYQRTGRWTEEETAYVDLLLEAFDKGQLPLPEGMRLNDFLRDVLLCKSSRLTKKMKHAKLSARCYQLKGEIFGNSSFDRNMMSSLEEQFLRSISSDASRLELRFNLTRVWRTLLSNLCLQLSSTLLRADDWIASLEVMERRAVEAEEAIRKARRQRMGMALKTDSRNTEAGVFFSGVPVARPVKKPKSTVAPSNSLNGTNHLRDSSSVASDQGSENSQFLSQMLDLTSNLGSNNQMQRYPFNPSLASGANTGGAVAGGAMIQANNATAKDSLDDFSSILSELAEDPLPNQAFSNMGGQAADHIRSHCGPFLEAIASLIESANLPFQHADVWVPSFTPLPGHGPPPGGPSPDAGVRLYHAGYATRHDIDPQLYLQLCEYGEYSTRFSFAPGVGLPGRVYTTGQHTWERRIDQADPKFFERAGGARVYGIKTGLGIALPTNAIGRIVIALYSRVDLQEDPRIVQLCKNKLEQFSPEPKWKLVIDMAPGQGRGGNNMIDNTAAAMASLLAPPNAAPPFVGHSTVAHVNYGSQSNTANVGPLNTVNYSSNAASAGLQGQLSPMESSVRSGGGTQEEEQKIAVMLGDHIPLAELPEFGSSATRAAPTELIPLFMSLRLLLLRSPCRRSAAENEAIDVICRSYRGYSQDRRRNEKEIAFLLVKDYQMLSASLGGDQNSELVKEQNQRQHMKRPSVSLQQQKSTHTCHVMDAPAYGTFSSTGAPTRMPSLPDISKIRSGSYGSGGGLLPEGTLSRNVNIVDEH